MNIYTITIKNDASVSDGHGKVHTWAELSATGKDTEYIGFTAEYAIGGLFPYDGKGKFQTDSELMSRPATNGEMIYYITKEQCEAILARHRELGRQRPSYDVGPENKSDYNCTTYINEILKAGGIYDLDGIQTPFGLESKIFEGDADKNAIERCQVSALLLAVGKLW